MPIRTRSRLGWPTTSCTSARPARRRATFGSDRSSCAALLARCDAVHPGYGFLSEQPALAEACAANGLVFVGPGADVIRRGGDKVAARTVARRAGVPVGAGSDTVEHRSRGDRDRCRHRLPGAAQSGRGRWRPRDGASRRSSRARYYGSRWRRARPRPRSAMVVCTSNGSSRTPGTSKCSCSPTSTATSCISAIATARCNVGTRRCSRRPRPRRCLPALHHRLADAAVALGRELDYVGAGTVEFLVDLDRDEFSFLEVNTRVQVEHPVTEMVTGVDIVREQLRIAAGAPLSLHTGRRAAQRSLDRMPNQRRIRRRSGFTPSPGRVVRWSPPAGPDIRVDTHVFTGYDVPALTTTRCSPSSSSRHRPRRRDPQPARRVGDIRGRRHRHDDRAAPAHRRSPRLPSGQRQHEVARATCCSLIPHRCRRRHEGMQPNVAEIEIIDQTLRDGQQSLWGMRMKVAHLAAVARKTSSRPGTESSTSPAARSSNA